MNQNPSHLPPQHAIQRPSLHSPDRPSQHPPQSRTQLPADDGHENDTFVEDARTMLAATAHMVEENVAAARERLAAALDSGAKLFSRVEENAVEGAKITDKALHDHPYPAIVIALGVGVLIGHLTAQQHSRNHHWLS